VLTPAPPRRAYRHQHERGGDAATEGMHQPALTASVARNTRQGAGLSGRFAGAVEDAGGGADVHVERDPVVGVPGHPGHVGGVELPGEQGGGAEHVPQAVPGPPPVAVAVTQAPTLNPVSRRQKRALVPSLTAPRPPSVAPAHEPRRTDPAQGPRGQRAGRGSRVPQASTGDVPVGASTRPAYWTKGGERHQCQDFTPGRPAAVPPGRMRHAGSGR
jgi:hypothetical protein